MRKMRLEWPEGRTVQMSATQRDGTRLVEISLMADIGGEITMTGAVDRDSARSMGNVLLSASGTTAAIKDALASAPSGVRELVLRLLEADAFER